MRTAHIAFQQRKKKQKIQFKKTHLLRIQVIHQMFCTDMVVTQLSSKDFFLWALFPFISALYDF